MSELYTIGRLSKVVNISADTLRYYDKIGLLKPNHTDRDTGYRYYTISQAADINRILELKEFGFTLSEIKEMPANVEVYRKRHSILLCEKLRTEGILEKLSEKIKNMENKEDSTMKRVLLVDDAAFMRMMCKDIFGKHGYDVVGEADNGETGVEKFKELSPDLVIMNIVMPRTDGIEALRRIKTHDPDARVLMLSASAQRAMVLEALSSGARRFVAKPFQGDKLIEAACEALETSAKFNPEALKLISGNEQPGAGRVLSQASIDEIVQIAESDTATAKTLLANFTEIYTDESVAVAPAPESKSDEQLNALLAKIVRGQDDIKELLQALLAK